MYSFGANESALHKELNEFRRGCNAEISKMQLHSAKFGTDTHTHVYISDKLQQKFLFSIAKYSAENAASPYYLASIFKKYNLHFIGIFLSMFNVSNFETFQHRFCMLAGFLCMDSCWTFMDQIGFCELITILLTHTNCLAKYVPSTSSNSNSNADSNHNSAKPKTKQKQKQTQNQPQSQTQSETETEHHSERVNAYSQKLMICHNFIQWLQSLALPHTHKVSSLSSSSPSSASSASSSSSSSSSAAATATTTNFLTHHRHEYRNLDRTRIFQFINLVVFHKFEIFKILIDTMEYSWQQCQNLENRTENQRQMDNDSETEDIAMHNYLCQIYFTQFTESVVQTMIFDSPLVYIVFVAKIYEMGYLKLAQYVIETFEESREWSENYTQKLISDTNKQVAHYLSQVSQLLLVLTVNSDRSLAALLSSSKHVQNDNHEHSSVVHVTDEEILGECKALLRHMLQMLDYLTNRTIMALISPVLLNNNNYKNNSNHNHETSGNVSNNSANMNTNQSENGNHSGSLSHGHSNSLTMKRMHERINIHRNIIYTNLASIAMIERNFGAVIEYTMIANACNSNQPQSFRYLISGLLCLYLQKQRQQKNFHHSASNANRKSQQTKTMKKMKNANANANATKNHNNVSSQKTKKTNKKHHHQNTNNHKQHAHKRNNNNNSKKTHNNKNKNKNKHKHKNKNNNNNKSRTQLQQKEIIAHSQNTNNSGSHHHGDNDEIGMKEEQQQQRQQNDTEMDVHFAQHSTAVVKNQKTKLKFDSREYIMEALEMLERLETEHPFVSYVKRLLIAIEIEYEIDSINSTQNTSLNYLSLLDANLKQHKFDRYCIQPKYRPTGRCFHSLTRIGQRQDSLIMFGGMKYNRNQHNHHGCVHIFNDIWLLNVISHEWQCVVPRNGGPIPRFAHSACVLDDLLSLLVIGGKSNQYSHLKQPPQQRHSADIAHGVDDIHMQLFFADNNTNTNTDGHGMHLVDIFDTCVRLWYSPKNVFLNFMPLNMSAFGQELCNHHSIYNGTNHCLFVFPIGFKVMYILKAVRNTNTNTNTNKNSNHFDNSVMMKYHSIYWMLKELPKKIQSSSVLYFKKNTEQIVVNSFSENEKECYIMCIDVSDIYGCGDDAYDGGGGGHDNHSVKHMLEGNSAENIIVHVQPSMSLNVFTHFQLCPSSRLQYCETFVANNLVLMSGGLWIDSLQEQMIPILMDRNSEKLQQLLLNINSKMLLFSFSQKNKMTSNTIQWIGSEIIIEEFLCLPKLFGHRMAKMDNDLIIFGGISSLNCNEIVFNDVVYCVPNMTHILQKCVSRFRKNANAAAAASTKMKRVAEMKRKEEEMDVRGGGIRTGIDIKMDVHPKPSSSNRNKHNKKQSKLHKHNQHKHNHNQHKPQDSARTQPKKSSKRNRGSRGGGGKGQHQHQHQQNHRRHANAKPGKHSTSTKKSHNHQNHNHNNKRMKKKTTKRGSSNMNANEETESDDGDFDHDNHFLTRQNNVRKSKHSSGNSTNDMDVPVPPLLSGQRQQNVSLLRAMKVDFKTLLNGDDNSGRPRSSANNSNMNSNRMDRDNTGTQHINIRSCHFCNAIEIYGAQYFQRENNGIRNGNTADCNNDNIDASYYYCSQCCKDTHNN